MQTRMPVPVDGTEQRRMATPNTALLVRRTSVLLLALIAATLALVSLNGVFPSTTADAQTPQTDSCSGFGGVGFFVVVVVWFGGCGGRC